MLKVHSSKMQKNWVGYVNICDKVFAFVRFVFFRNFFVFKTEIFGLYTPNKTKLNVFGYYK